MQWSLVLSPSLIPDIIRVETYDNYAYLKVQPVSLLFASAFAKLTPAKPPPIITTLGKFDSGIFI